MDRRFDYHPSNSPESVEAHEAVRSTLKAAAIVVDETCPDGREKSLAVTAIEEALMWANAAIARSAK